MIDALPKWLLMRPMEDDFDIDDWETPEDLEQAPLRPSIGIALGSGAAKGWAHIGILRALEDGGIRPDIISGTSAGALVGGCYAAGKLDELEEFALSIDKRKLMGLADFRFGGSGLLEGAKLDKIFLDTVGDMNVENLDRPFTSVASELGTGHEIWIGSGPLMDAIKASTALPGIFPPFSYNSRWLVDGALVNPVPISVCRALGARVVIAVDLTPDVLAANSAIDHAMSDSDVASAPTATTLNSRVMEWQRERDESGKLPGMMKIMLESFNIIMDRIGRSRLAGDPPDIRINPKLGEVALFDFHKARELIDAGYEAGRRTVPEIREYLMLLS